MCAHHAASPHALSASTTSWLTWLGGGERSELRERHERSAHAVTGLIVLIDAVLSWLVTTLAFWPTLHRWAPAVLPFTLVFAALVGMSARAVAAGPTRGTSSRAAATVAVILALVLGGVTGEFASLAVLSGPIDQLLRHEADADSASSPAASLSSANLRRTREARVSLDHAVDSARDRRDQALVVARCEYHPTAACPQTRITGVPGAGPETQTANRLLADAQRELDRAVAARDLRAPDLEAQILTDEQILDQARQSATKASDHGLGARWIAMQTLTHTNTGMLMLRLLTVGFFVALGLLPWILRQWRGDTSHDRQLDARIERERADLLADTAIAVKRAQVRAAAETLWAEQQLAQARLAVEAQTEIDRAQLRQRVTAAVEVAKPEPAPLADDIYLPIAAEAHAASLAAAPSRTADVSDVGNLPAIPEPPETPAPQTIPSLDDVTRAAARWIRPLVPDFVNRAIDSSTHPLRTARQVIEEVEQITISLTRTRRVTVEAEEGAGPSSARRSSANSWSDDHDDAEFAAAGAMTRAAAEEDYSLPPGRRESRREITKRDGPGELPAADGPRQLPPAG